METVINVLLIEDSKGDYVLTRELLSDAEKIPANKGISFQLAWADRLTTGLQQLGKDRFDVILLDLSLPDAHGLDGFRFTRAVAPNSPILVLTGYDDETQAINAVHAGAQDYLVKGKLDPVLLSRSLRYAVERHRIIVDMENAREASDRQSRAKSDFLIHMSDEISNPLKGIIRTTKLILDGDLPKDQRERLESVKDSAHSLLKVIGNVHDFAAIEGGMLALKPTDFKLREYFSQIVAMLEVQAKQRGVELVYNIKHDVPNRLFGDPERLGQVVTNLVENAIRFGRTDIRSMLQIDVDAEPPAAGSEEVQLQFTVTVSDIGISIDEQQLIFESFAQADISSARKYGPTGLGLAMSSKLVGLMGGRAWVKSEPGMGTAFHFTAVLKIPR